MLKSKAYWAIGIATLPVFHSIPATASEFASYEECILEKMGGVTSNVAAQAIKQACYKLTNPNPPTPPARECITLKGDDAPIVGKSATLFAGIFEVSVHNPSTRYKIEEIVMTISFDVKGEGVITRDFKNTVYAPPQNTGYFKAVTGINEDNIIDKRLYWELKSATGCKS
jgi:hypothetical protein